MLELAHGTQEREYTHSEGQESENTLINMAQNFLLESFGHCPKPYIKILTIF